MMLLVLSMLAAVVIVVNGLFFAINNITRHTAHGIRIAWILMTTGALGVFLGIVFSRWRPSVWDTALFVGLALYLIFERRRPTRCGSEK